jgi:hypothetical protein
MEPSLAETILRRSKFRFIQVKPGIHDASFASKSPFRILSSDWPISIQVPSKLKKNRMHFYSIQVRSRFLIQVSCMVKMAGKEETPKCRKKTVTRTNEMIEDLIDFIEIHPIVAFEAIYEPMLTSFWSLISFAVQLYIIMQ